MHDELLKSSYEDLKQKLEKTWKKMSREQNMCEEEDKLAVMGSFCELASKTYQMRKELHAVREQEILQYNENIIQKVELELDKITKAKGEGEDPQEIQEQILQIKKFIQENPILGLEEVDQYKRLNTISCNL